MALITCPKCGHQMSDRAVKCPGCGYSPTQQDNNIDETTTQAPKLKHRNTIKLAVIGLAIAGISFAGGIAFSGSHNSPSNSDTQTSTQQTGTTEPPLNVENDETPVSEFNVEWSDGAPDQFGGSDSTASVGKAKVVKSSAGEYVLTIDFTYTNESKDAKNFINDMHCSAKPYQEGIELESPGVTSEPGAWDYSDAFTNIKNGATIETQLAWILRDTKSPVEIEFGMGEDYRPLFIKTLNLS